MKYKIIKLNYYQYPDLEKWIPVKPIKINRFWIRVWLIMTLVYSLSLLYDVLFR